MQKVSHLVEYFRWYLLLFLIILSAVIWYIALSEQKSGTLKFAVLDIGQGDALYIESPTGVQVIVDGGPNKTLMKEISALVPWYDRHIDMIVVTNPDRDHYEGFIPLLDKYSVDVVLEPGTTNPNEAYKILEDKIKEKNIPKILAKKGQRVELGGGAYIDIIFPDRDVSGLTPNDGSIVMKLVYGDTSIMLQGDSTAKIEEYLRNSVASTTLRSTVLKVGHHGSRTSSTVGYVKAVSPEIALASSGKENDYRHPHQEVIDTFKKIKHTFIRYM
jgi:competence protein ComEC